MLYLKTDGVLMLKQRHSQVQNVARRRLNDLSFRNGITVRLPIIYQQCVVNLFSHHLCNVDNVGYMHCPTSLLMHFQTQELQFLATYSHSLSVVFQEDNHGSQIKKAFFPAQSSTSFALKDKKEFSAVRKMTTL